MAHSGIEAGLWTVGAIGRHSRKPGQCRFTIVPPEINQAEFISRTVPGGLEPRRLPEGAKARLVVGPGQAVDEIFKRVRAERRRRFRKTRFVPIGALGKGNRFW